MTKCFDLVGWCLGGPILRNLPKIERFSLRVGLQQKVCRQKCMGFPCFSNLLVKRCVLKMVVLSPQIVIQKIKHVGSEVAEWWRILTRVWVEGSEPQDKY